MQTARGLTSAAEPMAASQAVPDEDECSEEIMSALQKGRKWRAWALSWGSGGGGPAAVECAEVEASLREELRAFFHDFSVGSVMTGDRLVLRVCISERTSARSVQRRTSRIYLLYFLRSDLVLASTIKAEYAPYLKHAVCCALGCRSVAERGLSGRQVDALKELVLAPVTSPDLLAAMVADDAAVVGRPPAQRRASDVQGQVPERDTAVVDECVSPPSAAKRPRQRQHEPGRARHCAPLQHISIRVTEASRGHTVKVTLNGPDALQGVRDLAESGLLIEPPEQVRDLVLGNGDPSNEIDITISAPGESQG